MKMNFTLQYASNFFLDLHKRRDFKKMLVPCSENLALLGNVCRVNNHEHMNEYKKFIDYCSKEYKNIYIVPGVWEMCSDYSPKSYNNCLNNLFALAKKYKNVRILNNSHVSIPNTNIQLIGSTLWSRNPYMKHECMFEYNFMYTNRHSGIGHVMGDDIKMWHFEDLQFIRDMTKSNHSYIVLSHHLPHHILVHDISRLPMEASNLEKYMKKPIEIWLGGAGDHSVTGSFGMCRDVFCGVNPYTSFRYAKQEYSESYLSDVYVSLRHENPQLV